MFYIDKLTLGENVAGGRYSSGNYEYIESFNYITNWHPLKAIIIGSDMLPVVEEYLPISHNDGFLQHYETDDYKKALTHLKIKYDKDNQDMFNMNTQKVLDVYYPLSTTPGDIRSNIIHTRENLNDGQNIELVDGSPITRFNVWVKWLDIYNNLHDLYLLPGCSADIRFCFTKKTIYKEDLRDGFDAVLGSLPEKREKKAPKKSNGKPNGLVLDGADKYGFIHL